MPSDKSVTGVYRYSIAGEGSFQTRHEAVGKAAIRNRKRDDRRPNLPVWSYQECDCEQPQVSLLDVGRICARCGQVINA